MLFLFNEVRDETDRLNRLSKTHFVCENSVQVVIIQRDHPLETFKLLDSEHLHRKKKCSKPGLPGNLSKCLQQVIVADIHLLLYDE